MPTAHVAVIIRRPREEVFDLIHDYTRRLEWDPFLREAVLLDHAKQAGRGVVSRCVSRLRVGGFAMETIYVSFNRPSVAAVKMIRGPFFLETFAATLRQETIDDGSTRVTYLYRFTARPRRLAFLLSPAIQWVFHRETVGRLMALKRYLETE